MEEVNSGAVINPADESRRFLLSLLHDELSGLAEVEDREQTDRKRRTTAASINVAESVNHSAAGGKSLETRTDRGTRM